MLKIPVKGGVVVISNVPFSNKVLGTILSVGRLCKAGVFPLFSGLLLSLVVCDRLITTTFHNDCWWMNVKLWEGTIESAAETPSLSLIVMNPLSFPSTSKLSFQEWHVRLGHARNRVVKSFLKQHVPSFEMKTWQSFYCKVCAKSKSTHGLARAHVDVTRDKLLYLLISNIMGPFDQDPQGFRYLLIIRDHVLTFSIIYPLKSRLDAPAAVLDAITHFTVQLETSPKVLWTDNAREFTSGSFTTALPKLGIGFYPSLPYFPQENGKAKCLNQTLGDMARAMLTKSSMPSRFWQFAYASACYLHNRLRNQQCPNSSPNQVLYGRPPSFSTLYPFGERAIVHVLAVQQSHKLDARGIEFRLLKPLLASGGWLLWDPANNRMIHLASVIFPRFQTAQSTQETSDKGSLRHLLNAMTLGKVPTEIIFVREERAINSLPLAKDILIPENLKQALAGPYRHHWEQACLDKLQQMKKRGVWQAIKKTPAMKTIGYCWVFDTKIDELGNVKKFKAQLVACGDQQQLVIDCRKTYAPTASLMSLRLLLATTCLKHWKVCSFDVSGAYLYSPVEETVLMEPPTHFIPSLEVKVLCLKKALYGMKQVGRCDMSLYVFRKDKTIIARWIHVDDGVIASSSPTEIKQFRKALCSNFEIKWSENMKQIVGLECAFGEGEVTISQTRLTGNILDAYPRRIIQHDSPLPPITTMTSNVEWIVMDTTPFRLVIGSLAYLVSGSRLDLAFAVNYLAKHLMAPMATHWDVLNHLVGYLLKPWGHSIILRPGESTLNLWSDTGWGGELEWSQSGFMLKLGNTPILWGSKRQTMVALSTCVEEYIALSNSTQHLVQAINQ
ncbi:hypothetical protein O181_068702 [Austropuccinia psidii MF-1]|uniref:Integrase catalytic domain-containing protein n=1 Tax=Austropuccinia psidii MF-1 TaxID=1389203 RepID=A0A9Q3I6J2_9BASI|nr:hypothetical protein [Austropuccinia psidii MF-1]